MCLVNVLLLLNYKKIEEPPATLARVMGAQCKKELQVGGDCKKRTSHGLKASRRVSEIETKVRWKLRLFM